MFDLESIARKFGIRLNRSSIIGGIVAVIVAGGAGATQLVDGGVSGLLEGTGVEAGAGDEGSDDPGTSGDADQTDGAWQTVETPASTADGEAMVENLRFVDDRRGWMAVTGPGGQPARGAWRTEDGGDSWEQVDDNVEPQAIDVEAGGERVWMSGLHTGSNKSKLWMAENGDRFTPNDPGLSSVSQGDDLHFWGDEGLVTGFVGGHIARVTGGGEDVEEREFEDVAGIHDIHVEGDEVWLAGGASVTGDAGGAALLYSQDRGRSWELYDDFEDELNFEGGPLESVFADGDEIWAAGHNQQLFYSRDGGESWEQVMEIPDEIKTFAGVALRDDHVIAAGMGKGGGPGYAFESRDGGETWETTHECEKCGRLEGVEYPAPDLAYIYGGPMLNMKFTGR